MKRLLLSIPLVVATAVAVADEPPTLIDPLPFSHDTHRGAFRAARLVCIDCHPVGRSTDPPVADMQAPLSTCHACHLEEIPGVPHGASNQCGLCHSERSQLLPADHVAAWREDHGDSARADAQGCLACHGSQQCFACHDQRGPVAANPHGPGFRVTHGVEARVDPQRCTSCHTGESCLTCHQTGSLPW
jgi:hypothetical protein